MGDAALTEAYNAAVDSLRRFRDAHLRIVALYIINPSHRGAPTTCAAPNRAEVVVADTDTDTAASVECADQLCCIEIGSGSGSGGEGEGEAATGVPGLLRGTGGTDLVRFLKGVRDRTSEAAFPVERGAP